MQFLSAIDDKRYKDPATKKIPDLLNQGAILMKAGKFKNAINIYNDALSIDPQDPNVLLNKAVAYSQLGEYDKAIELYGKVIDHNPEYSLSFYNMAGTLAVMGDTEKALTWLKKAIEKNPDFVEMAQKDDDFLYLRDNPQFTAILGL